MATSQEDKSPANTFRTFRRRAIFARWMDVFFLTIVATALCLIMRPTLLQVANAVGESLGQWHPGFRYFLSTVIAALTWWLLAEVRGFRLQHLINFRNFCCYPPTWFAALSCVAMYHAATTTGLIRDAQSHIAPTPAADYVSLSAGVVIASCLHWILMWFHGSQQERRAHESATPTAASDSLSSSTEFSSFGDINREAPIDSPEDDKFGMSPISRRIARMLQETPFQTIGLIGPYGGGKSSVLNMVEHYLKEEGKLKQHLTQEQVAQMDFPTSRLIRCRVNSWGFDDDATKQQILDKAIEAISEHADVLAISRVPAQYHQIFSSTVGTWGAGLPSILGARQTPESLLEGVDTVLACIGARVVIFLEDLDRNRNVGEYCKDVEALLDRIKDLHHISFVLSCGPEMVDAATLVRTCEHCEQIPLLDRKKVEERLLYFRERRFAQYPDDIYPLPKESRDSTFGAVPKTDILTMLGGERDDPAFTISTVLRNPRALKSSLRWSLRKWQALHGECDLDDILAASALHSVSSETYGLLLAEMDRFRKYPLWPESTPSNHTDSDDGLNAYKNFYAFQLKEQVVAITGKDSLLHEAIVRLTICLASPPDTNDWKPQGLFVVSPTDYWNRLNAGEIERSELRDQEFLQVLHRAQDAFKTESSNDTDELALELGTKPLWGKKLEQFRNLLDRAYFKHLVSSYFELIRTGNAVLVTDDHASDARTPFAYYEIWRVTRNIRIDDYENWLLREFALALDYGLPFATEMLDTWGGWDPLHGPFSSREAAQSIRRRSTEIIKNHCTQDSGGLLRLLRSCREEPYTLHRLLFDCNSAFGNRIVWSDWTWLGGLLIDAINQESDTALLPVALLVTKSLSDVRHVKEVSVFDEDPTRSLFPGQLPSLFAALSKDVELGDLSEGLRQRVEVAQQYAREQIREV